MYAKVVATVELLQCCTLVLRLVRFILQKEEEGSVHQEAKMPSVPDPDTVAFSCLFINNFPADVGCKC